MLINTLISKYTQKHIKLDHSNRLQQLIELKVDQHNIRTAIKQYTQHNTANVLTTLTVQLYQALTRNQQLAQRKMQHDTIDSVASAYIATQVAKQIN